MGILRPIVFPATEIMPLPELDVFHDPALDPTTDSLVVFGPARQDGLVRNGQDSENVRYGSQADICVESSDVRFVPTADMRLSPSSPSWRARACRWPVSRASWTSGRCQRLAVGGGITRRWGMWWSGWRP